MQEYQFGSLEREQQSSVGYTKYTEVCSQQLLPLIHCLNTCTCNHRQHLFLYKQQGLI